MWLSLPVSKWGGGISAGLVTYLLTWVPNSKSLTLPPLLVQISDLNQHSEVQALEQPPSSPAGKAKKGHSSCSFQPEPLFCPPKGYHSVTETHCMFFILLNGGVACRCMGHSWVGGWVACWQLYAVIAEAPKYWKPMAVLEFTCCWGRKSACFKPTIHQINTSCSLKTSHYRVRGWQSETAGQGQQRVLRMSGLQGLPGRRGLCHRGLLRLLQPFWLLTSH